MLDEHMRYRQCAGRRLCNNGAVWQHVIGRVAIRGKSRMAKQPNVAIDAESNTSGSRENTRRCGSIVSTVDDVRDGWLMVGAERLMSGRWDLEDMNVGASPYWGTL